MKPLFTGVGACILLLTLRELKTDRNSMQNDSRPYFFPLSENISSGPKCFQIRTNSKQPEMFVSGRTNSGCQLFRILSKPKWCKYSYQSQDPIHQHIQTIEGGRKFPRKKKIYSLLDVDPTWAGYFRHLERRKIASSSSYRTSQSWHRFQFKTNAWLANSHNDPNARRHVLKLKKPQPKLPIRLLMISRL